MKTNRNWTLLLVVALAIFGFSSCARETGVEAAREDDQLGRAGNTLELTAAEQDFMTKVTQSNVAEIMLARQAMQKSTNEDVKDFAHMIEADHSKALENLVELMQDKNMVQTKVGTVEAANELAAMNRLSAADYDREFANMMVEKHQKGVELFRDQAVTAQNADLKDYVTDLLPTLEMHLQKAQSLQSKLFGGATQ